MRYNVIIIGAGQAGLSTAAALRQKKYSGSILLIGKEKFFPYQRPPLSKAFLLDSKFEKTLYLKSEDFYKKKDINILTNVSVSEIQPEKKAIVLDKNQVISYEKLVISTGSKVNEMNFSNSTNHTHYLRTIDDAIKLRNTIKKSKEIVIIGAGYIGLEVASAALKHDTKVSIIETSNRILGRSTSRIMATFLQKKHESLGIEFLLSTSVLDVIDVDNKKRVICNRGFNIDTDGVLIAIGIKPEVALAKKANIKCDNGIVVDENGRTSDKNIFSVGDCTSHPSFIYNHNLRLESVQNAIEQAKSVASSIIGENEPYNQVPTFWSDQYNLKLKIAGIIDNYDSKFIFGDTKKEKFAVFFIKNQRVIAVESINHQKAFLKGKKLIKGKCDVPKDILRSGDESFAKWLL